MNYYSKYKKYKLKYLELTGGNPLIDRVRRLVENFNRIKVWVVLKEGETYILSTMYEIEKIDFKKTK